jgi:hypothetical protein
MVNDSKEQFKLESLDKWEEFMTPEYSMLFNLVKSGVPIGMRPIVWKELLRVRRHIALEVPRFASIYGTYD